MTKKEFEPGLEAITPATPDWMAKRDLMKQAAQYLEEYWDQIYELNPGKWVAIHGERIIVLDNYETMVDELNRAGVDSREARVVHMIKDTRSRFP